MADAPPPRLTPAAEICYPARVLGKRLLCVLAICTIAMSAVGRLLPSVLEVVAYCCCGPHDAQNACHCPDCPAAHAEGDGPRAPGDDSTPALRSCLLEQLRAHRPLTSPAQVPARLVIVAPRRLTISTVFTLPATRPSPLSPRIDEPPRG